MGPIRIINLRRLELPGEAGPLYAAKSIAALVRELGDNYARYHTHLASEVARIGRPRREDYADADGFLADWQLLHEVVTMEAFLRSCRDFREGRRPGLGWDKGVPLIDERDRLVAAP